MQLHLSKDNLTSELNDLKYIIEMLLTHQSSILYFLSPDTSLKSSLLKSWMADNGSQVSQLDINKMKFLSLDFDSVEALDSFNDIITEENLFYIYAYYAKHKTLPNLVLNKLLQLSKEKNSSERITFLIKILLAHYFLQENNLDLANSHIKYCIEYINENIDSSEYENMVTYVIFGKYLEKTKDAFVSYAVNYYKLAREIADKIQDKITLLSVLNNIAYYYHNIDNPSKAMYYVNKALILAKELDFPETSFTTYKNLAIISNTMGDFITSSIYMKQSIETSEKINNFSIIENVKLKNSLGFVYFLKGSFKDALDINMDALKTLFNAPSSSELLEEAVKTFDNISLSFRNLGEIKNSIYFAELTIKLIRDCNFGNRINDIQNLCSQYTDLGILYGLYYNDFANSLKYYNLAKLTISKEDHYIKFSNLLILQSFIECSSNKINEAKTTFESSISLLQQHGSTNIYVQILLLCYYLYFSTKFDDYSSNYIEIARSIAEKYKLKEHFVLYSNIFINKISFEPIAFNEKEYPVNLILLLSEDRKNLLSESKKSRDFELVQNFSNKISLIFKEDDLYKEVQEMLKKHFLTKGFVVIKHSFNSGFDTVVNTDNDCKSDNTQIRNYFESFILQNNLVLNSHIKEYDIFNYSSESSELFKSIMIFYLYDEFNSYNYFFIMFYDTKSDWLFSQTDANVSLVLMKNLFLKLKTIHYTEKIRKNSLIDHATGLYNAKYMWSTLGNFIHQCNLKNLTFSMTILDLNHFKTINDTFGHYAGDEAIRFFSKILSLTISPNNHIIRYGGDEFIVISPGYTEKEAEAEILKVLNLCKAQPFVFNNRNIFINFSFGVLKYNDAYKNGKSFFHAVDKVMYANKKL